MDDFVILDASRERLEFYKSEINEFLKSIKLELHPQKTKVVALHAGVKLLGFRVFYKYKLLKRGNLRRIPHTVQNIVRRYTDRTIDKDMIFKSMKGWNAYAMHGNTYKLRKRLMKKLNKSIKRLDSHTIKLHA